MKEAGDALEGGDLEQAFACFERAHVLGQWYAGPHCRAHVGMLRVAWRRRDLREIIGQLLRIPGGLVGSTLRRVPRGNTGGANVSAFLEMPIPEDLAAVLALDRRSRQPDALDSRHGNDEITDDLPRHDARPPRKE